MFVDQVLIRYCIILWDVKKTTPAPTGGRFPNCIEPLPGRMQVRWALDNQDLLIQMSARLLDDQYMAFGVSPSKGRSGTLTTKLLLRILLPSVLSFPAFLLYPRSMVPGPRYERLAFWLTSYAFPSNGSNFSSSILFSDLILSSFSLFISELSFNLFSWLIFILFIFLSLATLPHNCTVYSFFILRDRWRRKFDPNPDYR